MITRIKICGLRDVETAKIAVESGADAIGLVFYAPSPRNIEIEMASKIAQAMPPFVSVVGLFVNAEPDFVRNVLDHVPLDILQFHGDESPEYCRQFKHAYLKAIRVNSDTDLLEYAALHQEARALLVDAYVPGVPGGSGETFDWSLLPHNLPMPLILSGGLNPENVAQAIEQVKPWAVDVSSGVESSKGVKDVRKIVAFNTAVRKNCCYA